MVKERNTRWLFHLTYWTFVLGGYGLLAYLIQSRQPAQLPWFSLLMFFAFLWGADTRLGESQASGGRVMSSKCIVLSVIALFGAAPAALMEAVSALARGLVQRGSSPRKAVFNSAMLSTAAGAAGLVYEHLPWSDSFAGPGFFIPLSAAMVVHSIVNQLMLGVIISLDARVPFERVYRRSYTWARLRGLLDLPFAAMVVLLYLQAGAWTLVLFLFPVLALYQSDRLYQRNKEAHINSIAALTTALEADEPYTHGHSYRVAKYAVRIGKSLGMHENELETLEYGGLLHDIGKIAITNEIICKPGRLTDSEFEVIKTHPTIGADIVEQIKFLSDATELVRHHHERPDGRGYPHGLARDEISIGCAILNVCDAFDAMTSDRPYRKALSVEQAMEELVRYKGTQFDERVVDTILRLYHQGEFDSMREVWTPAVPFQPASAVDTAERTYAS
ncbi:MAG TPA: HD-GYP domain-containing protein [Candidatus Krumholzibacteria bacterium]|nr:HD-GYP domain-containing protein [Candidatus Krumholzibacteria bacterium]HPD71269.1 HD-GYP domain-containing protein [Candidatus Krumholzibacteria bacterium]HRY39031.1 HD-GYP domain-containing protein [Candidatus Krumholzibacteria bacterium]